jgi:hypothetical protein
MVRRLVAALLVLCCLTVWAGLAIADDGITPPPTDPTVERLSDKYPPEGLRFETAPGWKYTGLEWLSNVEAALFYVSAVVVKWTGRAMDYAVHFNVARWTGDLIDPINTRMSNSLWAWGGLIFSFIGIWIALQFWQGQYNRISGQLLALSIILALALWVQGGVADWLADMDDAGTEIMAAVMVTGSDPNAQIRDTMATMEDGLYRQLILDPWARANFSSIEAASKPDYMVNGIPGDVFLGLSVDEARAKFEKLGGFKNPDLAPWYTNSSMTVRGGIAIMTLLTALLFLPILLLCILFIIGAEALGVLFCMGLPFATWIASMPWFAGLRFLRAYFTMVLFAPIVKILAGFGMAMYLAFVAGLMDAAPKIKGGWTVVNLIVVALLVTAYFLAKPLLAVFGKLLFTAKATGAGKKVAPAQGKGQQAGQGGGQRQQPRRRPPAVTLPSNTGVSLGTAAGRRPAAVKQASAQAGVQLVTASAASQNSSTGARATRPTRTTGATASAGTAPQGGTAPAGGGQPAPTPAPAPSGGSRPHRRPMPRTVRRTMAPTSITAQQGSGPVGAPSQAGPTPQTAQAPGQTAGPTRHTHIYHYRIKQYQAGVGTVLAHRAISGQAKPQRPTIVHVAGQRHQAQMPVQQPAAKPQPQVVIHRHHHDHKHTHVNRQPAPQAQQYDRRPAPKRRPRQEMELTEVLRLARLYTRAMNEMAQTMAKTARR